MKSIWLLLGLGITGLLLAACGSAATTATAVPSAAYPVGPSSATSPGLPALSTTPLPYPASSSPASPSPAASMAYPVNAPPANTAPPGAVPFRLNKPVHEGDTQVTGTGTAGVPLLLQDVTFMGKDMGQMVISDKGTFVFQVPALEKNHRLGIALGNLEGTPWKAEDFTALAYQGDESMQVPWVRFYFDTVLVQAKP